MPTDPRTYRFGDFALRPGERQLARGGVEIVLRPKAFDVLLCLVERHGHAVSKDTLLDVVWPGVSVSEAVLTHCIAEVRQALGDEVSNPSFVRTISRHGYKFVAAVDDQAGGETEGKPRANPGAPPAADAAPAGAIVVLPFANLSADPENDYFCDGLSEELINALTKVAELKVVAHSSSFAFKGRDIDAREIGRQLGVGTILEGSVRKAGSRVRICAQLIDAASGYHLWSEQYDRELQDIFAIQDEIATAILARLNVGVAVGGHAPLVRPSTGDMDAYALHLQGRWFWHQRYAGCLEKAMDCFGRAIARDPGFAPAYAGLADSLSTIGVWGFTPARDVFPKAATLAETAQKLDPDLAEAHASRGLIRLFWDWDWSGAERDFRRALELGPGCALIHLWYGHYLTVIGRMDEAIVEVKRAQALDPVSPVCSANVGWTYNLAHQLDQAVAELRQVLAREPGNGMALFYLGYALIDCGRYGEAVDALRKARDATRGMPWSAEGIALALGLSGKHERARAALAETSARAAASHVPASALALVHLGLGHTEAVLGCLERAVDERDVLLPWAKFMPIFDRLHGHPRFDAVLSRLGLPGSE